MRLAVKIIRQSFLILIIASIISSIGGFNLESVQKQMIKLTPLIILFPALNDLTGDFGCIISSKFTTLLYLGQVKRDDWWRSKKLRGLFLKVLVIALISAVYLTFISLLMSNQFTVELLIKLLTLSIVMTSLITVLIFLISIITGLIIHKLGRDPDNYLIPITTSIADLISMLLFVLMINLIF